MRRMELLAPAGGPEQLEAALHFGADAVYLAGRRWGMRSASANFDDAQLAAAVERAHTAGARVHVALNALMTDPDMDDLPAWLRVLDESGADAAIVADLGALALLREHAPHVEPHLSTQVSCMNAVTAEQYLRLGVRRVVLAREMTLPQVAEMRRRTSDELELEVFAHGSMCMAVSGRCLLSSDLTGGRRAASLGNCAQPCRWSWAIAEEREPGRAVGVECDGRWSYLLSSNDLCMIEHLDDLAEAGVDAIKLEGRAKGAAYAAVVTNAYRHVLDGGDPAPWRAELDLVSHRPYSTGFFYGDPTQNPGDVDYARDRSLVGVVRAWLPGPPDVSAPLLASAASAPSSVSDPANVSDQSGASDPSCSVGFAEVECRNRAPKGATLDVLSPGQPVREAPLLDVVEKNDDGVWVSAADGLVRSMGRYRVRMPFPVDSGDLLLLRS